MLLLSNPFSWHNNLVSLFCVNLLRSFRSSPLSNWPQSSAPTWLSSLGPALTGTGLNKADKLVSSFLVRMCCWRCTVVVGAQGTILFVDDEKRTGHCRRNRPNLRLHCRPVRIISTANQYNFWGGLNDPSKYPSSTWGWIVGIQNKRRNYAQLNRFLLKWYIQKHNTRIFQIDQKHSKYHIYLT